jgi:ribonuclease T2
MKKITFIFTLLFSFLQSGVTSAKGLDACFLASNSCEAFQSFRKKTNPEGVHLESGKFYKILEKNKRKTAYRVRVEGIKRSARWVSESCGESLSVCSLQESSNSSKGQVPILKTKKHKTKAKKQRKQPEYLLALSWQPSFCETHSRKKECRTQTRNRYDATHWSLHGLWPQPRNNAYCGVSYMDKGIDRNKKWHLLAPVKLSQKTATELAFVMPAVASNLQRHEWIKHGTCYGSDAEDYYSDAISLTNQINNSLVGKLFNRGIGKRVSLKQVRQHFDKAFGKGAGSKVDMRCDKKGRVSELWINLKGEVEDDTKIATLLKNSIRAGSKCQIGVIDKANR